MSANVPDAERGSQRRKAHGLETVRIGIDSLSLLARFNQFATAGHHDPLFQFDEADALDEAISLLKSVVLPALQERVPDDTQGNFREREEQTKDDEFHDEFPTKKRRRRSQSEPTPRPSQSTARSSL